MNQRDKGINTGKIFSEETRAKMSKAKKGKYKGEKNNRAKTLLKIDPETSKILEIFITGVQAEEETGILRSSISQAAQGKIPTAGGFHWMFGMDNQGKNEIGMIAFINESTEGI